MAQLETKKVTTPKVKLAVKKTAVKKVVPTKEISKPAETKSSEIKSNETIVKQFKYSHPDLKVAPRKLRLLLAYIKKFHPSEALNQLQFVNTNAARQLKTVLKNAINTAKNNNFLIDSLKFISLTADEGKKNKRMDKGHGSRFARGIIIRRHSRLNITLSGKISSQ